MKINTAIVQFNENPKIIIPMQSIHLAGLLISFYLCMYSGYYPDLHISALASINLFWKLINKFWTIATNGWSVHTFAPIKLLIDHMVNNIQRLIPPRETSICLCEFPHEDCLRFAFSSLAHRTLKPMTATSTWI